MPPCGPIDATEARIMLQNDMATGAHPHETATSATVAAWLAARGIAVRRGREAAVYYGPAAPGMGSATRKAPSRRLPSLSIAGKKGRRRRPLRMTAKAQRRRWIREHNRRMRALALRKMRDASQPHDGKPG